MKRALAGPALAAALLGSAPVCAHEGSLTRVVRASTRALDAGALALDVLSTCSLPRTASMLVIAQLDLNHDGRFDALETALAESMLGDRADLGLVVELGETATPPTTRQVAVQVDVEGKHVSIAVLSSFTAPAAEAARFGVRFAGPGEPLEFSVTTPPGLTLAGPTRASLVPGAPALRFEVRVAPAATSTPPIGIP
jgi:hypothetical protein